MCRESIGYHASKKAPRIKASRNFALPTNLPRTPLKYSWAGFQSELESPSDFTLTQHLPSSERSLPPHRRARRRAPRPRLPAGADPAAGVVGRLPRVAAGEGDRRGHARRDLQERIRGRGWRGRRARRREGDVNLRPQHPARPRPADGRKLVDNPQAMQEPVARLDRDEGRGGGRRRTDARVGG